MQVNNQYVKKLLASMPLSASKLESYAACPYNFFMRYVLNLSVFEEALDARVQGMVAHACLQYIFERVKDEDEKQRITQENKEYWASQLENYFDQHAEELIKRKIPRSELDISDEQYILGLKKNLLKLIDFEAKVLPGFVVDSLELEVEGEYAGRRFHGFIDRVDRKDNLYVIRDYKLGNSDCVGLYRKYDPKSDLIWTGENKIQAALYAKLLQNQKNIKVVGSLYQSIRKPSFIAGTYDALSLPRVYLNQKEKNASSVPLESWKPRLLAENPRDYQHYLELVEQYVESLITSLEAAKFPRCANGKGKYCELLTVCGMCKA